MQLAMIGLGKMGANMVERLLAGGHQVVVHDVAPAAVAASVAHGARGAASLAAAVAALSPPRVVWLMLPAGKITADTVQAVAAQMQPGDVVVDGGNSNYQDTLRHAEALAARRVHLVDVGTSGGIWGRTEGYSMMVGGDAAAVACLRPALETLAPATATGWGHVGPTGAGHFVKMVHNGIEYGMMQSYAEGFHIMARKAQFKLDLPQVAEIWRHGSVVRSWLLDLLAAGLKEDASATAMSPQVADSGEGRWTVAEAIALDVPAPVITASLIERLRSRQPNNYASRLLSMMRNKFGGHSVLPPPPSAGSPR